MATQAARDTREGDDGLVGVATLDEHGRVTLPKATRQALHLHAGSSLAYVVVDGAILLIPQDRQLAQLSDNAAQVLQDAGVTVDDLLAVLPAVREEILGEEYGDAFVDALARAHAALHSERR